MKKLLLTLLAVVGVMFASTAAEVVVDFAANRPSEKKTGTFTVDGVTFTTSTSNAEFNTGGYLFLKPNGYATFSLDFDCTSIAILTSSGQSTNNGVKLTVYAGETSLGEQTINTQSKTYTYMTGAKSAAGTVYKLEATGTKNPQIVKLTLTKASNDPTILVNPEKLSFATGLGVNDTKTVAVVASNLTQNVTATVDNTAFTLAKTTYTSEEIANGVEVTYNGATAGEFTGTLTLTSGTATATVALSAITASHAGTEADPFTVENVIALNNALTGSYYVTGTISDKCAANAANGVLTETETLVSSNIVLKEGTAAIGVALPIGDTRTKLNIADNPGNIGQTIIVKGSLEAYFGAPGVKDAEYISGLKESDIKGAGLSFSETTVNVELGAEFVEPTLTKETTAAVTYSSSDESVAKVDATTGKVEIIAAGTAVITASAEATEGFAAGKASYTINVIAPVAKATVALATSMTSGKFVIYTEKGVAMNFTGAATATYGYLFLDEVTVENNEFEVNEAYLIEFTETAKGYTMLDNRGKYLGMDATHFGSFNFYDTADADGSNCYWTITFDGNNANIVNAGRSGAYLSYKEYNGKWELVTTDNTNMPAIQLFKVKDTQTAISEIEAAEEGAVEYYNLQGVRVANPEAGLYIRRQGTKATKVFVK